MISRPVVPPDAPLEALAPALLAAARDTLPHSYSPYSHFPVAAAVLSQTGEIFVGTNVENASFGLTLCAERAALASAISAGARSFTAIALVGGTTQGGHLVPCGACRQWLLELMGPTAWVITPSTSPTASPDAITVGSLLPDAFQL